MAANRDSGDWARNGALLAVAAVLCLTAGEFAARLAGHRPWTPPHLQYEVAPGDRLFAPDAELGWVNLTGRFEVSMDWDHTFFVTVDERGNRLTRAAGAPVPSGRTIWILGGSYTHGWLVDDAQSYPWLVQQHLSELEVVNLGVPGYGTLQSLLQFERALAQGPVPEVVVLAYASFHDIRNTAVRRLRKARLVREADEAMLPSGSLSPDGSLQVELRSVRYRPLPFMQLSALAHLVEETWNRLEVRLTPSHEVTRAVIERLLADCEQRGVRLIIVGLTSHPETLEMLDWWRVRGLDVADISFDAEATPEYRFVPYDNHPGPLGHAHYAERLVQVLADAGVK